MKNILLKTTTISILASSLLLGSGWRLPESSSRSIALSGAYIANSNGADATYYNPANMSFNKDALQFEVGLMDVILPSMTYTDNATATRNGESKKGNSLIPSFFISSKDYNNIRYGFSLTIPGGLTREWDTAYQKLYAEQFSLQIIELNPTISYKISNDLSFGGGFRVIKSSGIVKSDGTDARKPAIRDMEGETTEYGYNLALAYKPTNTSNLSATYRSNIDLKEDGNAKLYLSGTKVYDGGTSVTVPLPAVLTFAYAHTFDKTTIELEYDKTYWSTYKTLDFEYKSNIPLALQSGFDNPKARDWQDTNAYRIGITHKYNDTITLMVGYSKDGNAIPDKAVSFESPDYNSNTYSAGFDYELDKQSSFGFGYLYSKKDDRTTSNTNPDGTPYINGTISGVTAHLISVAYRSSF